MQAFSTDSLHNIHSVIDDQRDIKALGNLMESRGSVYELSSVTGLVAVLHDRDS